MRKVTRKKTLESAWFHYTLLVLLIAGATSGGLVFLGCDGAGPLEDPDYTVNSESHQFEWGGVIFPGDNPDQETTVNMNDLYGSGSHKVQWYKPKNQPYLKIPDPNRSWEIVIVRPPDDVGQTEVTVEGDSQYTHVTKTIHVENYPRPN